MLSEGKFSCPPVRPSLCYASRPTDLDAGKRGRGRPYSGGTPELYYPTRAFSSSTRLTWAADRPTDQPVAVAVIPPLT